MHCEIGGVMDEHELKEEIRLIKDMVEKTRKTTAESGAVFIFWGFVIIAAIIGTYALIYFSQLRWIWINWIAFMALGFIFSAIHSSRRDKTEKAKTYAQINFEYLCKGCAIVFVLMGLVFPMLNIYSYEVIPILMATIGGLLLFVTGVIYELSFLKWCGGLWWVGALAMIPIPGGYRSLAFIPLLIVGYLVPGFIFNSRYRKNRPANDNQ